MSKPSDIEKDPRYVQSMHEMQDLGMQWVQCAMCLKYLSHGETHTCSAIQIPSKYAEPAKTIPCQSCGNINDPELEKGYRFCLKCDPPPMHLLTVRSIDGSPTVFIAEINGREVGRMSATVMPLVHDMEIPASPIMRKVADALFFYASGKVKAAGFSEAAVFVAEDNERMKRYVESRGAVGEEKSSVYMMAIS